MSRRLSPAASAVALVIAGATQAYAGSPVVFDGVEAPATLQVSSPAIRTGGLIAMEFTGYGRNIPPAVAWSGAPSGTRAYVLVVQDPDAPGPRPIVHWVAYDIPGALAALARKTPNEARLETPRGMMQGPNDHGGVGWTGPHPPVGDPAHHYHVQVFALDRPLKLRPGATLERVAAAMKGRVLAKGEAVGLYAQAPPQTGGR